MPYYTIPCDFCGLENNINHDVCEYCGKTSLKTTNVKRALIYSETDSLKKRYYSAVNTMAARGVEKERNFFEDIVLAKGAAVINLNFNFLWEWLMHGSIDYQSYRRLVLEGLRQRADFEFDIERSQVESLLFGSHVDIVYAALTLNSTGLINYGLISIMLKTPNIEFRTSILEKNSYVFVNESMSKGWHTSNRLPPGHFAPWDKRNQLALVKCHDRIGIGINFEEISDLILHSEKGNRIADEFLELYIYGKISKSTVEKIKFPLSLAISFIGLEKDRYEELKTRYLIEEYDDG